MPLISCWFHHTSLVKPIILFSYYSSAGSDKCCRQAAMQIRKKIDVFDAVLMDVVSENQDDAASAHTECETKTWNTELLTQGTIKTGRRLQPSQFPLYRIIEGTFIGHLVQLSILQWHLNNRYNRQCHRTILGTLQVLRQYQHGLTASGRTGVEVAGSLNPPSIPPVWMRASLSTGTFLKS